MNHHNLSSISFEVALTEDHFMQILSLQKQNHYTEVSSEQQIREGFVFVEHSMEILQLMAVETPQIIALHNNLVIGYTLGMTLSMKEYLPCLVPFFTELGKILYKGKTLTDYQLIVGGQVCVNKEFRRMGLLGILYNEAKKKVQDTYDICVTEVSNRNIASLNAHLKAGFEVVHTYSDEKEFWSILAWDFGKGEN